MSSSPVVTLAVTESDRTIISSYGALVSGIDLARLHKETHHRHGPVEAHLEAGVLARLEARRASGDPLFVEYEFEGKLIAGLPCEYVGP